jgi:hypothetical protein
VLFARRFPNTLPILVFLLALACTSPTDPPTTARQTSIDREWQYEVAAAHSSEGRDLGGPHQQEFGVVCDLEEFGRLTIHPADRDSIGKAEVYSNSTGETY